jgi:Zn-dependent peptidase ImmA (M78 family)
VVRKRPGWKSAAARRLIEMAGQAVAVDEAVAILAGRFMEGVPCPPTDLSAVAARLNVVDIREEDLLGSGELRREKCGYVIICATGVPPARKRFTVGHELGHALFEMSGPNCPRNGKELEQLCNKFATEILMPKSAFLTALGPDLSLSRIFDLAKLFQTSLSATAIRCCELRKAAAFEMTDGEVRALAGSVRRFDAELRRAMEETLNGTAEDTIVYLNNPAWTGYWKLEGAAIGRNNRALFLMQPVSRTGVPA